MAGSGTTIGRDSLTPTAATAWYAAAAVVMTWPLVLGLSRDIPWDLGDSILNAWILQWGADRILALSGGDIRALSGYWSAPIFYPEPLALAYSEHLTAQVLQALPVYAATGNIILAYNAVFLATFVLSGLGMFLFVRELTGSPRAAFLAGLIYAFVPYRIGQFSHVQVLSSQWMPFVLFGLARYFRTRRARALTGAAAATIASNLSCSYYLLFFPPFVGLYAAWEIGRRGLWRERRLWLHASAAAAGVALVTLPFVLPYVAVRAGGFEPRPVAEVAAFSADVYGYATSHSLNRVWGRALQIFPKPEGELFPGVVPLALAALAALGWWRGRDGEAAIARTGREGRETREAWQGWRQRLRRVALPVAAAGTVVYAALFLLVLGTGGVAVRWAAVSLRVSSPGRTLVTAACLFAAWVLLSPRLRAALARAWRSPVVMASAALLLAWALSLGPRPETMGRHLADWGPYTWLYAGVPGFDGLRVPARFAMIAMLFLAVLAGFGAAGLQRRSWLGRPALALLSAVFLAEATAVPIVLNGMSPLNGVATPEGPLRTGANTPAVYRAAAALPAGSVLAEFPFGIEDYDLRYMLASGAHRHPLLNGYSGGFPLSYVRHRATLGRVLADPDLAWQDLAASGATHAIVHERAFLGDEGLRVSAWLESHGARPLTAVDGDRLFQLPVRR